MATPEADIAAAQAALADTLAGISTLRGDLKAAQDRAAQLTADNAALTAQVAALQAQAPASQPAWVEALPGKVARLHWSSAVQAAKAERSGQDAEGWPADGSGWNTGMRTPPGLTPSEVGNRYVDFTAIPPDWPGTFTVTDVAGHTYPCALDLHIDAGGVGA